MKEIDQYIIALKPSPIANNPRKNETDPQIN